MSNFVLPVSDKFVEEIAKAMSKDRLMREATGLIESMIGIRLPDDEEFESRFEAEFNQVWDSTLEECVWERQCAILDVKAVINKINYMILTTQSI